MAYIDKYGVEFSEDRKTLIKCPKDFRGAYIIPDGVTTIEKHAFCMCGYIEKITLPDSVSEIGRGAFSMCIKLTEVNLPEGITRLRDTLFECTSLKAINIPESVTHIEPLALSFHTCDESTTLYIPKSLYSIESYPYGLKQISVSPENPNYCSINGVMYSKDCSSVIKCPEGMVGEYSIPEGVKTIGEKAFYGCKALTKITIPDTVVNIEKQAFQNCESLVEINIPIGITEIKESVFSYCTSLEKITLPDNIEVIGDRAFCGSRNLKEVNLGSKLKTLGISAFSVCEELRRLVIPQSIKYIGDDAFLWCSSLSLTVPKRYQDRITLSLKAKLCVALLPKFLRKKIVPFTPYKITYY